MAVGPQDSKACVTNTDTLQKLCQTAVAILEMCLSEHKEIFASLQEWPLVVRMLSFPTNLPTFGNFALAPFQLIVFNASRNLQADEKVTVRNMSSLNALCSTTEPSCTLYTHFTFNKSTLTTQPDQEVCTKSAQGSRC